ncbi:MAG: prolyl-tRNA synthetase associated domain-containing protein [Pseudomonadota bacterium]
MSDGADTSAAPSYGSAPRGFERLSAAFAALGIDPPLREHEAVFTVAQSQHLRGQIPGVHTKNLFLKDKKGALFLLTAPEDAPIDLKKLHTQIGARGRVSFASAQLLAEHLGVVPGSVTPLALINDEERAVTGVLHPIVASAALVNVHPLRNNATVTLTGDELVSFLSAEHGAPRILDLTDDQT